MMPMRNADEEDDEPSTMELADGDLEDLEEETSLEQPFMPRWLVSSGKCLVAGTVIALFAVTVVEASAGAGLSQSDAQADALWVDYNHAVTHIGGGSTGNGGRNTGIAACPGSPEAVHAKCDRLDFVRGRRARGCMDVATFHTATGMDASEYSR